MAKRPKTAVKKPRRPEPFFRPARGLWYVQIGKRQFNLGPDEAQAWTKYHQLMGEGAPTGADKITWGELVDRFLGWTKTNRKPRTWRYYCDFFQTVFESIPKTLLVKDLKVHHVTKLLTDNSTRWPAADSQRGACVAIKRAINWAKKQEIIQTRPLDGMEMPQYQPREIWYEDDQWQALLDACPWEDFRDLLVILRETGARPLEARQVTAANFERRQRRWSFTRVASKGGRYKRQVLLSDLAFQMTCKAALKYPEGPLFRNSRGQAWTNSMIHGRIDDLTEKLGWRPMLYAVRHTFAVHALRNGVDSLYVASLMGHRDLNMVAKVYGHIGSNTADMQKRLKQALEQSSDDHGDDALSAASA